MRVVATDKLERVRKESAPRVSKYQPEIDKLMELEEGQSLIVDIPEGEDAQKLHTRYYNGIRKHVPEGYRLRINHVLVGRNKTHALALTMVEEGEWEEVEEEAE